MERKCYAKINLTLDSLYKRDDGYHEIDTIMARISLFDRLIVNTNEDNKFTYESNTDELGRVEDNLIYKAYNLLKGRVKNRGIDVKLIKNIPLAAGLAGGSTDAAEMIKALNILWDLRMDKKEMMDLGARLGADIPFFFLEKTARARGIGEILTPFTNKLNLKVLLVNDGTEISSAYVYKNLKDYGFIDNERIVRDLIEANYGVIDKFSNVMEEVIFEKFPHLLKIRDSLINLGARKAMVSGSGASIFAIFADEKSLEEAYEKCLGKYKTVMKVDLIDD
ncbi:MAG: 4-(cytidine 5'-diphospho)-2-C-methyl-D-erythritol kinase [Anaerococcus sp.]|nr:4-(cytidine 5'-diphospho)-2-C-methyl-D-erythritol kinase [Anaerococcus sp.]